MPRARWLALLALAALLPACERARDSLASPDPVQELADLRAQLDDGRTELARLQREVALREREVAALRARSRGADPPVAVEDSGGADAATGVDASPATGREGPDAAALLPGSELPASEPAFDPARFAASGLTERDGAELRELFEATELERLDVRDRAKRERWPEERLAGELAVLDERLSAVRRERGDPTWDWLLYSTGRPNRVVVQSVLGRSAAEAAGLEPGDVVYAYDGARLFHPEELVGSTRGGRLNERVELEVERAGQRVRVGVPRGPLGVKVAGLNVRPADAAGR
ncbi:MAG TPA: PDZ domain-containing protein [Myxococcota bacterium]|nr:PDZ domain-containing protein [Myxococcota bacterium]